MPMTGHTETDRPPPMAEGAWHHVFPDASTTGLDIESKLLCKDTVRLCAGLSDAGRTQPFGTGATCFYNYLRNNRNNIICRHRYSLAGEWLGEEQFAENHAFMMYEPCLPANTNGDPAD
jgi:hypothetical protein